MNHCWIIGIALDKLIFVAGKSINLYIHQTGAMMYNGIDHFITDITLYVAGFK